jgi:hypothetical protein
MIAPPQVQAHNFAKAIRTDIVFSLSDLGDCLRQPIPKPGSGQYPDMQGKPEQSVNLNGVNLDLTICATKICGFACPWTPPVPIWNRNVKQN